MDSLPADALTTSPSIHKQRAIPARCFVGFLLLAFASFASAYEPAVSLVFLGDIMLGRGVAEAHAQVGWESTLQSLHPFTRSADLALANLESPIGCGSPEPFRPRLLAAPPAAAAALTAAGFDILSTVNNHALDAGDAGAACTRELLAARGILTLTPFFAALETRRKGIDILFLALNLAGETASGGWEHTADVVRQAHAAGKFVVVSLHWGMEYQSGHDSLQLEIARAFAGAHADILWGHHSHVVQEIEWIGSTLVLYSLGNAVFDQQDPESVRRGELVWVEADRRGVRRVWILPFPVDPRRGSTGTPDLASLRVMSAPAGKAQDIISEE